jgi:hypothetical protein
VRTFIWLCVKFMAVTCFFIVLVCVGWVIRYAVELNLPGMLGPVFVGLLAGVSGYYFWTQTDDIALGYVARSRANGRRFWGAADGLLGRSQPSSDRTSAGNPNRRATGTPHPSSSPVVVDPEVLRAHVASASGRRSDIWAGTDGQDFLRWTRIIEWADEEAAWADSLPDLDCLATLKHEYREAADALRDFADRVFVALGDVDPTKAARLVSEFDQVEAGFLPAVEAADRLTCP